MTITSGRIHSGEPATWASSVNRIHPGPIPVYYRELVDLAAWLF